MDEASDEASDENDFFIESGTERVNSGVRGVRGVGQPFNCSQQSSQTLPGKIGELGDS